MSCLALPCPVICLPTHLQRLAEERFFDQVPCILVTGKGVPDLATRQALGRAPQCNALHRMLGHVACALHGGNAGLRCTCSCHPSPQFLPPLACRALLSCLCDAFPQLPVVGLVDWNPSGANILSVYRFGSQRMSQESSRYALASLGWLGARYEQLQGAEGGAFQVRWWEGGA